MTDFEGELRDALARREPPRDLTGRIMARIEPPRRMRSWRPWLAATAAAALLAARVSRYQEYRKGQEAKQQVMLALEITAQKLAAAQQKIGELSQRRIGHDH